MKFQVRLGRLLLFVYLCLSGIGFTPSYGAPVRPDSSHALIDDAGPVDTAPVDVELPTLHFWPENIDTRFRLRWSDVREQLVTSLFDALEDLNYDIIDLDNVEVNVGVGRYVVQNFNKCQSLTVIDRYQIRGQFGLLDGRLPFLSRRAQRLGEFGRFGLFLAVRDGFEFIHAQVVVTEEMAARSRRDPEYAVCSEYTSYWEIANGHLHRSRDIQAFVDDQKSVDRTFNPEIAEREASSSPVLNSYELLPGLIVNETGVNRIMASFFPNQRRYWGKTFDEEKYNYRLPKPDHIPEGISPTNGLEETHAKLVELYNADDPERFEKHRQIRCNRMNKPNRYRETYLHLEEVAGTRISEERTFDACVTYWMKRIFEKRRDFDPLRDDRVVFAAEVLDVINDEVDILDPSIVDHDPEDGDFEPREDLLSAWIGRENWHYVADLDHKKGYWELDPNSPGTRKLKYHVVDSDREAHYRKLRNLLLITKIPVTLENYWNNDYLKPGEIRSWTTDEDGVELGPTVGWNNFNGLRISGRISTFWHDIFRISVLKESDRFARVKTARHHAHDGQTRAGSLSFSPIDGTIVFDLINLEKSPFRFVPFRIDDRNYLQERIEASYRYDLSNPQAREAFELAVNGRFARSDEYAIGPNGEDRSAQTGVEKLGTRHGQGYATSRHEEGEVPLLWTWKNQKHCEESELQIEFRDDNGNLQSQRVFEVDCESTRKLKTLWGGAEKTRYRFSANLDLDRYETGEYDFMSMNIGGFIDDSQTRKTELEEYIDEVESAVGQYGRLFPRVPEDFDGESLESGIWDYVPPLDLFNREWVDLDRYQFSYQFHLDNDATQLLFCVPEREMWFHLERAFGIERGRWEDESRRKRDRLFRAVLYPFTKFLRFLGFDTKTGLRYFRAARIKKYWERLRESCLGGFTDVKDQMPEVRKMFYDEIFGKELVRLTRSVLNGRSGIPFFASGTGQHFGGRLEYDGLTELFAADRQTSEEIARSVDWELRDEENIRRQRDHRADVSELQIRDPNGGPIDSNRLVIEFTLPEEFSDLDPQYIHNIPAKDEEGRHRQSILVRLDEDRTGRDRRVIDLIVPVTNVFAPGKNVIPLDRSDQDGSFFEFLSQIEGGKTYRLLVRVSRNGGWSWGGSAQVKFVTTRAGGGK